jgi:hypothetical protein
MSPLRNPWVTGVLVLAAAGFVAYQVIQPRWQRVTGKEPPPPAPALPPSGPVAPQATPSAETPASDLTNVLPPAIEQGPVQTRLPAWLESPARDPFFLASFKTPEGAHQYLSPVRNWKLKAIWRQTGARVAAINKSVYAEGDEFDGYRVRRIENDGVWLEGPVGLERLEFPKPGSGGNPAPPRKP